MNKMIYHVRINSYLFLFWVNLQVCHINFKCLLYSSHIQNAAPESKTEDRHQGRDSGQERLRTGP